MKNFTKKQLKDFEKYVKVQMSGKFDMITEWQYASAEAGLTEQEYVFVIKNYIELKNQYNTTK